MTSSRRESERRRRRGSTRLLGALAAIAFAFVAAEARAQRTAADLESARRLYNEGIELREKGDARGALEKFQAAHALGNTPLTGIELCKAYAALGQPVEAREVCLGVARIPRLPQETARSDSARSEASIVAEEQRPKIGGLRLKIDGVPRGREPFVTVDGVAVPVAALGEPRAVNPGPHVVTARVGSGKETRVTASTREGEQKELVLTVEPPPKDEVPVSTRAGAEPVKPPAKKRSPLVAAGFVVGGVAAAVGTIAGIVAIVRESDLEDQCGPEKQCGRELHGDLDAARTWATVSTVSFVVAGVAFAGGIVALLTSSSKAPQPRPAQSRASPVVSLGLGGIHGSF